MTRWSPKRRRTGTAGGQGAGRGLGLRRFCFKCSPFYMGASQSYEGFISSKSLEYFSIESILR